MESPERRKPKNVYYLINSQEKNQLIYNCLHYVKFNNQIKSPKYEKENEMKKVKLMAICELINVYILLSLLFGLTEAGK